MPRFIIKLQHGDESRYLEWSTIVDAPVTYGMTLEEFREYYRKTYGEAAYQIDFPERLARTEENGTSAFDYTLARLIKGNRAGPSESHLTEDGIWDRYCTDHSEG